MRLLDVPLVAATEEPVTVAEVKADARIDGTQFDASIPVYIAAARALAEHETGRRLVTQTLRYELDDWPSAFDIIDLAPLQSVEVSYWNGAAWTSLPQGGPNGFGLQHVAGRGFLVVPASSFPALGTLAGARVRLDVVVGYGGAEAVPESIKLYIRAHCVQVVDNPSLMVDNRMQPLSFLTHLLDPFRTWC